MKNTVIKLPIKHSFLVLKSMGDRALFLCLNHYLYDIVVDDHEKLI